MKNIYNTIAVLIVLTLEVFGSWEGNRTINGVTYFFEPGVNLSNANLSNGNLGDVDLDSAILVNTDFSNANLSGGAYLIFSISTNANFSGANLSNSYLYNGNFSNADFSNADLRNVELNNANLSGANLTNADLSGANLTNADLSGANLEDAIFNNTNLNGVQFESNTNLYSLSEIKDLRVGSQTFSVSNGNAKIRMYVDESGSLTDWTNTPYVLELDIPADTDTKFFRFRMD